MRTSTALPVSPLIQRRQGELAQGIAHDIRTTTQNVEVDRLLPYWLGRIVKPGPEREDFSETGRYTAVLSAVRGLSLDLQEEGFLTD